jgi:hypothetical protein
VRTADVRQPEPPQASKLDEIRRAAEHRLQEIEPLIAEADRLRDVLSVIDQQPQPLLHDRAGNGDAHASRARKGANKRIILELVAQRPGITPAEIAQVTGVKRTVVASTVSRLKRHGELEDHEAGGVRIPAMVTGERTGSRTRVP